MKRWIAILLCFTVSLMVLSGCRPEKESKSSSSKKLNVVTTIFPYYDFIRQIGKDKVHVKMIVSAGKDSHTFEPTPSDLITIQKADVFLYNGGAMEYWVQKVLKSHKNSRQITYAFMNSVHPVEEEVTEGMSLPKEEEGRQNMTNIFGLPLSMPRSSSKKSVLFYQKRIRTMPAFMRKTQRLT